MNHFGNFAEKMADKYFDNVCVLSRYGNYNTPLEPMLPVTATMRFANIRAALGKSSGRALSCKGISTLKAVTRAGATLFSLSPQAMGQEGRSKWRIPKKESLAKRNCVGRYQKFSIIPLGIFL